MILIVDELVLDELPYGCNAWICVDCGCTSLDCFHCLSVLSILFLLFLMLSISYAQWFGCADCYSLIPLYSLMESMLSAYYVEVYILYPQYHDCDAGLIGSFIWLFDIAVCILWYPDFTPCSVALFWSVADSVVLDVCVSVDCLVMRCMWQPLKCMLWAWSTHDVRGRCERGWLDCWEWKMVVWL